MFKPIVSDPKIENDDIIWEPYVLDDVNLINNTLANMPDEMILMKMMMIFQIVLNTVKYHIIR